MAEPSATAEDASTMYEISATSGSLPLDDFSRKDCRSTGETSYTPIRVLGRGAFGQAVLYRKIEVSLQF